VAHLASIGPLSYLAICVFPAWFAGSCGMKYGYFVLELGAGLIFASTLNKHAMPGARVNHANLGV